MALTQEQALDRINSLWSELGSNIDGLSYSPYTPQDFTWLDYTPADIPSAVRYDASQINPTLGQYVASTANASQVGAVNPYTTVDYEAFLGDLAKIDTTAQDQSRASQMASLQGWKDLAATGLNQDERSAVNVMNKTAQQARQRAEASIKTDMEARGQYGSGAELAARLAGAQGAANMASDQGNQLAQLLLDRQTQARSAADGLNTNIRSADQNLAAQQAQLFNDFQTRRENIVNNARQYSADQKNTSNAWAAQQNANNAVTNAQLQQNMAQFNTNSANDASQFNSNLAANIAKYNSDATDTAARYNSDAAWQAATTRSNILNDAAMYNQNGRQQVSLNNTQARNDAAYDNLNRANTIAQQNNENRFNYTAGYGNALNGVGTALQNQATANANNANQRTANWINLGTGAVSALANADKISNGITTATSWLKGLF